ncbi:MAG TPA: metal-sulfur cluster assembly factor [Longimicrobiales bacterium]|nr:metal-sulfur cluster assembly factor [Longimicrobiales bacterium]
MTQSEAIRSVAAASRRTRHDLVALRTAEAARRAEAVSEARARAGVDEAALRRAREAWVASLPHDTAALWLALCDVSDPELPISLVDLGLIYDIRRVDTHVDVDCTFTASACPCMAFIKEDIRDRLLEEPNVSSVQVHEVWDPPWTVERMTEEGRAVLRGAGVTV